MQVKEKSIPESNHKVFRALAVCIAPAFAVAFALVHMSQVNTEQISPWKGGSFGMFSTLNEAYHRIVYISVKVDGEWVTATMVDRWFDKTRQIIIGHPSQTQLSDLANSLAGFTWYETTSVPKYVRPSFTANPHQQTINISAIRVSVWQGQFDPSDKRFSMKLLAGVEKEISP